jgi:hypothetical protein
MRCDELSREDVAKDARMSHPACTFPPMKPEQRDQIIEDLTNECKYLLIAAETWEWLKAHPETDGKGFRCTAS